METLVVGDVVVVAFPYSDFSGFKRRPALVISSKMGDDYLLCAITTRTFWDNWAIDLTDADFANGKLESDSYIRPNKIGTFDQKTILYKIGSVKAKKMEQAIKASHSNIGK